MRCVALRHSSNPPQSSCSLSLSLLNSGSPTYLHPATASSSAIYLSITHPALYLDFFWQTDSDLHGSDHYAIIITTDIPSPSFSKNTWKLYKADWAAFSHQAALELCADTNGFKFASSKTVCMHFCRLHSPRVTLYYSVPL